MTHSIECILRFYEVAFVIIPTNIVNLTIVFVVVFVVNCCFYDNWLFFLL